MFVDITKGTPGLRAVTVFGRKAGESIVTDVSGYSATFGIDGVNINQLIGGTNRLFDANGEISFSQLVPSYTKGSKAFIQSAMRGNYPDECVSNLVVRLVK